MRILLLGKGGQLGWEANRSLTALGQVFALDYPEVDLTRIDSLVKAVDEIKPQIIFNAAAYTAVDKAEAEKDKSDLINAVAPGILAEKARQYKSLLVHFSTDYVFDGRKNGFYKEEDVNNPLNEYGRSKLAGEVAVQQAGDAYLILRTAWVYSNRAESFVGKVLAWARKNQTLRIVDDQVGSPTWARLLAETSCLALAQGIKDIYAWGQQNKGVYHLSGEGAASRYDWAVKILAFDPHPDEQVCREILAAKSSEFYNAFGLKMGNWVDGLKLAMG
ncbi:MAG: dTDP-4-dehydrorhamnose reductase [Anaerolineae bacterium]|nr:dTDP-4-dehydrorhamnose reductase [Anaerolineae bacterium]